jgi:acyl-CoA reductase-like NAD-dependent aldehyde dehydrogenase
MGIDSLSCYVDGKIIRAEDRPKQTLKIMSLGGTEIISAVQSNPSQIRQAIRSSEEYQKKLYKTTLDERVEVAHILLKDYAEMKYTVSKNLAMFRGQVAKDSYWMCDLIAKWADELETFVATVFGQAGNLSTELRKVIGNYGTIAWQSKGVTAMYSAASMDGPPNIIALCHGIISGTHIIIRPSWRDTVTHFAFDILYKRGLDEYAQLVRWPSASEEGVQNNKQLLNNVKQGLIFSSEETYTELMNSMAHEGSENWRNLMRRCRWYGNGLPLNIVTKVDSLDKVASDLVAGARLGCGRFCLSTTPVMVQKDVYPQLVKAVIATAKQLRAGSILDPQTELPGYDPSEVETIRRALNLFGGNLEHGSFYPQSMDVMILTDVPIGSPCLHAEIGAPVLALIPFDDIQQAITAANAALNKNQREAWTALSVHGGYNEFDNLRTAIPNYRALFGGVVAEGKLLLPHQGTYFVLDLMRRTTVEDFATLSQVESDS